MELQQSYSGECTPEYVAGREREVTQDGATFNIYKALLPLNKPFPYSMQFPSSKLTLSRGGGGGQEGREDEFPQNEW